MLGAGGLVLAMTIGAASAQGPGVTPEMFDKVLRQGTVLVIVTLRVPAGAPPATIQAIKQSVIGEIASTRHRVVRELTGLPQIALEASDDTLRILGASPNVLRIDESIPYPPLR
jgi:rRNA processing protein Krr1/Pno1